MVRAGGNRASGSVLQRANFDEETTRRLEAFRVGGADAKRPWYLMHLHAHTYRRVKKNELWD